MAMPMAVQWRTTQTSVSKRPLVHLIWTASQHHLRGSLPHIFDTINLIRGEKKAYLCGWGFATYYTWSDCFGGWKGRGRECEIRHVRRVISIEYGEDDAVEDNRRPTSCGNGSNLCPAKKIIQFPGTISIRLVI